MSKETFHEILNCLLTSTNYQSQEEVIRDLEELGKCYDKATKAIEHYAAKYRGEANKDGEKIKEFLQRRIDKDGDIMMRLKFTYGDLLDFIEKIEGEE